MSTKKKVLLYTIEVILILLVVTGLAIFKYYPEYKKTLGSSDQRFVYENYKSAVEVQLANGPNYILIIDKKHNISNILFENLAAFVLYNQEMEGKPIPQAISLMMEKLNEAGNLTKEIAVINYKDQEIYTKIKEEINKNLVVYGSPVKLIEKTTSLEQKAKEVGFIYKDEQEFWSTLYLKSSDLISYKKNNVSKKNEDQSAQDNLRTIDSQTAETYATTIYQKLKTYVTTKNIKDQVRDDPKMPIQLIPADTSGSVYADTSSWYYVKDYQIYAEISFTTQEKKYNFCYQGSLEQIKKGKCEV